MSAPKHGASFEIVSRVPVIKWLATCGCKDAWAGATYESVEDEWRAHRWAIDGTLPQAMGDKSIPRWEPPR